MRKGFKRNQRHHQRHNQGDRSTCQSDYDYRRNKGFYRSRHGLIMGVCEGISDYFEIPLFWVRFVFVVMLFFSGLWPIIGIYIIASFIMNPKPAAPLETEDEKDFYDTYVNSREGAIRTLKNRFEALERRIRRMEDAVTAREFEWDRKFNT